VYYKSSECKAIWKIRTKSVRLFDLRTFIF